MMWMEPHRQTREDRRYLAVLGRCLFVCQRIEATMKWLAGMAEFVDVADKGFAEEAFAAARSRIERHQLRNRIERFIALYEKKMGPGSLGGFQPVMMEGLLARNFLVHESIGLSELSPKYATDEEARLDPVLVGSSDTHVPQRMTLLRKHLVNLVAADAYLSQLTFEITQRESYIPAAVTDYPGRLTRWVLTGRS